METQADAVVIGGGIFGASVGHFLAKLGFGKIVLLEHRRPNPHDRPAPLRQGRFKDGEYFTSAWGSGNRA